MKLRIPLLAATLMMAVMPNAWAMPTWELRSLPVQFQGRLMPLESLSRDFQSRIQPSKWVSTADIRSIDWLATLLFDPEQAYLRDDFIVDNARLRQMLRLKQQDRHRYSFQQLVDAVTDQSALIQAVQNKNEAERLDLEKELLALYHNVLLYFELSRSLSLFIPQFTIHDELAKRLGILAKRHSFLSLQPVQNALQSAFADTLERYSKGKDLDPLQAQLAKMQLEFSSIVGDRHTTSLRVIPPTDGSNRWHSPWELWLKGLGTPATAPIVQSWHQLTQAWHLDDTSGWQKHLTDLKEQTQKLATASDAQWGRIRYSQIQAEMWYHLLAPINLALLGYGLCLLMTLLARRFARLRQAAAFALPLALASHLIAIGVRVWVLQRPPVATLYESILFVALIVTVSAFWLRKRNAALSTAALTGSALLLALSLGFASDGDTLHVLIAVLNSNFWLTTHVLVITAGYGFCMVASLIAHAKLLHCALVRTPIDAEERTAWMRYLMATTLIALFLVSFGTILGGIWADQSWGRFWGWDPKENGALLIVLWLAFMLHARLAKLVLARGFYFGMAATSLVVAVSWFGVNLLNVGLHSYGFTSGLTWGLAAFALLESCVLALCAYRVRTRFSRQRLVMA